MLQTILNVGRIEDPNGGWKGKGLWATTSTRALFHMEGGKGTRSKVVKFQLRPDPLAKMSGSRAGGSLQWDWRPAAPRSSVVGPSRRLRFGSSRRYGGRVAFGMAEFATPTVNLSDETGASAQVVDTSTADQGQSSRLPALLLRQ